MFKRSLIGYSKKSVNLASLEMDQEISAEMEKIECALNEALEEQSKLSQQYKSKAARLDEARFNTILIDKFQGNINAVIAEIKVSTEQIKNNKVKEADVFCQGLNRQITLIDQQIDMEKDRLKNVVQALAAIGADSPEQQTEGDLVSQKLNEVMERYRLGAQAEAELPLSLLNVTLGQLHSSVLEEGLAFPSDSFSALIQPDCGDNNLDTDVNQAAQMRARKLLAALRHYWRSTVGADKNGCEDGVANPRIDPAQLRADRLLAALRQYWRS